MTYRSWGNHPKIKSDIFPLKKRATLKDIITTHCNLIPYGYGRSYGDSALNSNIIDVRPYNDFIDFDEKSGLLHVQAGVLLSEILETFVQRGWFLRITPGTKFITVGGAIASDVHGKNHHISGCFSESVKEFEIMSANGEVVTCSRDVSEELFKATCGGQGLTGVILTAKIYLKRIHSVHIKQTTIKTNNLKETFEAFEEHRSSPYSVAWIDCLAKGNAMGRSLLQVGDFTHDGTLDYSAKRKIGIPQGFPDCLLNSWSVKCFNWLYYNRIRKKVSEQRVTLDTFFYPLDAIGQWNNIYGKAGFTQYQFILPLEHSYRGLSEALNVIADSGKGSFLAVLKLYGKANENWLSFPMEGYSLALDFKLERGISDLLDKLDQIVLKYNGRIYLTKDLRVSKKVFEEGYPNVTLFRKFRKKNGMDRTFQSLQSKRLGI
jgi:decaprenylphospho-beta-D-ribofuranose 2-oxidase